jgi:hypothetical protein
MTRRFAGTALYWVCTFVDLIPWRDGGKWYLRGCRGCAWGISNLAANLYGDSESNR